VPVCYIGGGAFIVATPCDVNGNERTQSLDLVGAAGSAIDPQG
jgi:hypothetical protein